MIEGPIRVGNVVRSQDGSFYSVDCPAFSLISLVKIDKDGAIIEAGWVVGRLVLLEHFTRVEMPEYRA